MNWKKHKLLSICGVLFLIAVIGIGFLLYKSRAGYVEQKTALKAKLGELDSLNLRNPFPSEENLEVVQADNERVQEFYQSLLRTMSAGQVTPKQIERAQFPTFLNSAVSRLRSEARAKSIKLPELFPFGFDAYAGGSLPEADHVERLTSQVQMMEDLVDILYASGIESLDDISREVFEEENAPVENTGRRGRAAPPPQQGADESDLYSGEKITLTFQGGDDSIWKAMNALVSDEQCYIVQKVELSNPVKPNAAQVPLYRKVENTNRMLNRGGGPFGNTVPPVSDDPFAVFNTPQTQTVAGETVKQEPVGDPLSHDKRIVAGREPVTATITVKVYQFNTDDLVEEAEPESEPTEEEVSS